MLFDCQSFFLFDTHLNYAWDDTAQHIQGAEEKHKVTHIAKFKPGACCQVPVVVTIVSAQVGDKFIVIAPKLF